MEISLDLSYGSFAPVKSSEPYFEWELYKR